MTRIAGGIRARVCVHCFGVALAVFIGLALLSAPGQAEVLSPLAWTSPKQASRSAWPAEGEMPQPTLAGAPERRQKLKGDELLLVPVAGGDIVRFTGEGVRVGIGSGFGANPDAIVWSGKEARKFGDDLRIPTWGTPRFFVAMAKPGAAGWVQVWLAARNDLPMAWHRLDERVADWAADPNAPAPEAAYPAEDANPILRWLGEAREVVAGPGCAAMVEDYLLARWLADSTRVRPLQTPFFAPAGVSVHGGTPGKIPRARSDEVNDQHRFVAAGEQMMIETKDADVLSVAVRVRSVGRTVLHLFEGESLAQELTIVTPLRAFSGQRWSPARLVRLVVPETKNLSVAVVRGEASVSVKGYDQISSVLDFSGLRSRTARLTSPPAPSCRGSHRRVLDAMRPAEATKSLASINGLAKLSDDEALSDAQRALLVHEALRLGAASEDTEKRLSRLWELTSSMEAHAAIVLRRSALETMTRARPQRFDQIRLELDKGQGAGAVPADERLALEAMAQMVSRPEREGRVGAAEAVERFTAAGPRQQRWLELARRVWQRAAPWNNLAPASGVSTVTRYVEVEPDEPSNPRCAMSGSMGTRWLQLGHEEVLQVAPRGGSHTRVRLAGDPAEDPSDGTVEIDGVPIVVHAGAGLRSSVAVKPGARTFKSAGPSKVLARVPTDQKLLCDRMREGVRWAVVREQGAFAAPTGNAMTVASVIVSDAWLDKPTTLSIGVGETQYEAWVRRGATGAMEVPVPGGVSSITVRTSSPQMVRVRMRLSPRQRRKVARVPADSAASIPSEKDMVELVRAATQDLRRATTPEAASKARVERIKWLELLGYQQYAAADRARLPSGVEAPRLTQRRSWGYAVALPPGSGVVEPIGSLPKIVALPSPKSVRRAEALRAIVKAREQGESEELIFPRLLELSKRSRDVDALLLGVLAEQNDDPKTAAAAFERIGRRHRSGVALARAARLRANVAHAEGDTKGSLSAYILARDALEVDGSGAGTLLRLKNAIDWRPVLPDRAAAHAYVYTRRGAAENASLAMLVRRALVDSPRDSGVVRGRAISAIVKRFKHRFAKIVAGCHALEGTAESCPIRVKVDGESIDCLDLEQLEKRERERRGRDEPRKAEDKAGGREPLDVARTRTCFAKLPDGAEKLSVAPPKGMDALLWGAVSDVTGPKAQDGVAAETMVQWFEVDSRHRFRIRVLGPTVIKVSARGQVGEPQILQLRLKRLKRKRGRERRNLQLSGRASGRAFTHPSREPLTDVETAYVTVHRRGRHELTIRTNQGRAWVRLAMAKSSGLPKISEAEEAPIEVAEALDSGAGGTRPVKYTVAWDRSTYPLSLSGELRYAYSDLTEADETPRDNYGQFGVYARRAFPSAKLWLRQTTFFRMRDGPSTLGGRLVVSRAPVDHWPGVDVLGRIAYQSFDSTWGAGWISSLSVHKPFGLPALLKADPRFTFTYRFADFDANREVGADSDVFSVFAARRPQSLDITLPVFHRPYIDMLNSYGVKARTLPDFDGLDAVEAAAQSRVVAGEGYAPLVRLRVVGSYRLESELRRDAFFRLSVAPSVVLWRWLGRVGRFSVRANANYFVDFPATVGAASRVSGFISLGYDAVGGRGLMDFTPSEKPFTERMEEGAEPQDRNQRGTTPYWEDVE